MHELLNSTLPLLVLTLFTLVFKCSHCPALCIASLVIMHLTPFFNRSIFDDFMDDYTLDRSPFFGHRPHSFRPAATGALANNVGVQNDWVATVRLNGYKPEEVKIERGEGNATVKVHARQGSGDDFSEYKKTIHVPENVDREHVDVDFNDSNGILMIRAPYKLTNERELMLQQPQQQALQQAIVEPFRRIWPFNLLTNEMRNIRDNLLQLTDQSFPGSMLPTFVQDKDGVTTRLNMDFDLRGFKPEEISVSQDAENNVTVEARHEKQHKDGTLSYKHFKQTFSLPNNVKISELQSKLMQDGRLRLDAPCEFKEKPQQQQAIDTTIAKEGVEIPVKREKKE